jgi:hypothetical protein
MGPAVAEGVAVAAGQEPSVIARRWNPPEARQANRCRALRVQLLKEAGELVGPERPVLWTAAIGPEPMGSETNLMQ